MADNQPKKDRRSFEYPKWIISARRVSKISDKRGRPIYVSILETARHDTLLDIRQFRNDCPTFIGFILTYNEAFDLIDILDKYLAGEKLPDLDDKRPE